MILLRVCQPCKNDIFLLLLKFWPDQLLWIYAGVLIINPRGLIELCSALQKLFMVRICSRRILANSTKGRNLGSDRRISVECPLDRPFGFVRHFIYHYYQQTSLFSIISRFIIYASDADSESQEVLGPTIPQLRHLAHVFGKRQRSLYLLSNASRRSACIKNDS